MSEEISTPQEVRQGSKTNLVIVGVLVLLLIGGIGVLAFNQKNTAMNADTMSAPTPRATVPAGSPTDEDAGLIDAGMAVDGSTGAAEKMQVAARTIEVEAGAFYYKPASITVKKGEKVTVVMKSKDMMHDFVVDELGIQAPVAKAGETVTFDFTADTVGTFEYYCSVGQHRKSGQVGTLIVTE
jgi:nitrosocyanin